MEAGPAPGPSTAVALLPSRLQLQEMRRGSQGAKNSLRPQSDAEHTVSLCVSYPSPQLCTLL